MSRTEKAAGFFQPAPRVVYEEKQGYFHGYDLMIIKPAFLLTTKNLLFITFKNRKIELAYDTLIFHVNQGSV